MFDRRQEGSVAKANAIPCKDIWNAFPDCGDIKYISKEILYKLIDSIRYSLGIEAYPLDPFELQKACGESLHLEFHRFGSDKIGGLLIKNSWPKASCMVLNSAKSHLSNRFDCAHELIHFFLHPTSRNYMCETLKTQSHPYEYQANEGAAELLLPYRRFIPHFFELCSGYNLRQGLMLLSKAYEVSLMVVQYRINSLSFEMDQYLSGCALSDLRILSRKKQQQGVLKNKELQTILDQINQNNNPLANIPPLQNLRFECVEYEEELINCGFYEPYYRGY